MLGRKIIILAAVLANPAVAQETSGDRGELDLAAGRVLFQNSPLSVSIVEVQPPVQAPERTAQDTPRVRRPVRVIMPSPYVR